jgi:hypothetical protein
METTRNTPSRWSGLGISTSLTIFPASPPRNRLWKGAATLATVQIVRQGLNAKARGFRSMERCFLLTFPFIEPIWFPNYLSGHGASRPSGLLPSGVIQVQSGRRRFSLCMFGAENTKLQTLQVISFSLLVSLSLVAIPDIHRPFHGLIHVRNDAFLRGIEKYGSSLIAVCIASQGLGAVRTVQNGHRRGAKNNSKNPYFLRSVPKVRVHLAEN